MLSILFIVADLRTNENNNAKDSKGSKMLLPWIFITGILLLYDIAAGIIFGVDISEPMKVV